MRRCSITGLAAVAVFSVLRCVALAAVSEPPADPKIDPAPCFAAAMAETDPGQIIASCGPVIDNEKTPAADRLRAVLARAAAFRRQQQDEPAIADYDAALKLDPTLADIFNARGELWRRKGERPRALSDFSAAIKLDPQHAAARANYKSLAQELERIGAQMAVNNKPSFNCSVARRPVEKAICADPALAKLDGEIEGVLALVLNDIGRNSAIGRKERREHAAYLATRNASFGRRGYDLHKAMEARLRDLAGVDGY